MRGAYPYCIVPVGHEPPPDLEGLDGEPVETTKVGPLTVWLSRATKPPPFDVERVRRHHDVVQAAAAGVTPVPVRYGEWSPDEDALRETVRRREEHFRVLLETVSGCLEYGVTMRVGGSSGAPPEPSRATTGREYMRALSRRRELRRSERAEEDELTRGLDLAVEGLVADRGGPSVREPGVLSLAHLVDRDLHERYLERVVEWAAEVSDAHQIRITGPWPPYSFT